MEPIRTYQVKSDGVIRAITEREAYLYLKDYHANPWDLLGQAFLNMNKWYKFTPTAEYRYVGPEVN